MAKNLKDFTGGTEIKIATNNAVGMVKGGGRVSIASDGTIIIDDAAGFLAPTNDSILQWYSKAQVKIPANTMVQIGEEKIFFSEDEIITVGQALDTGNITNGKDYCVYVDSDGNCHVSRNTTYPSGTLQNGTALNANNTRKIGGFHTLCVSAGSTLTQPYFETPHPLQGFEASDILPRSVWGVNFRPFCPDPSGMVYSPEMDYWVDIYNCSGDIAAPASVYQGTRLHTKAEYAFRTGLANVGKKPLTDLLFWFAALGSNEKTAVQGSAQPNPDITGGHLDTHGRRMISNIGCEEMNGLQWQWLDEIAASGGSSFTANIAFDGGSSTFGAGYGQPYCLRGGGDWTSSTSCGSLCRSADDARSDSHVRHGGRGCSPNSRSSY